MNDLFVWWVYGGAALLFGGYAVYLLRMNRALRDEDEA